MHSCNQLAYLANVTRRRSNGSVCVLRQSCSRDVISGSESCSGWTTDCSWSDTCTLFRLCAVTFIWFSPRRRLKVLYTVLPGPLVLALVLVVQSGSRAHGNQPGANSKLVLLKPKLTRRVKISSSEGNRNAVTVQERKRHA